MRPELGVLVALYNPSEAQIAGLIAANPVAGPMVAVDNSARPDQRLHDKLAAAGIATIANRNEGGIPGAYNKGLAHLAGHGCRVYFLLDQDSELPEGYFATMLAASRAIESECFLLGPKIFDLHTRKYPPIARRTRRGGQLVNPADLKEGELVEVFSVIASGMALSAAAYERLGPYREDFHLEHFDTEYCVRAVGQQVPIYVTGGVTLRHEIGERVERRVLGIRVRTMDRTPDRRYYLMRNSIRIIGLHWRGHARLVVINAVGSWVMLGIALVTETRRIRKAVAMLSGLVDGVRGRGGSFAQNWPRLAAFCAK